MYNDPMSNYHKTGWREEKQANAAHFSLFAFAGALILTIVVLFFLHQSDNWRPITASVIEHTPDNIVYAYQPAGEPKFTTAKFDYIDLLCQENLNSPMLARGFLHPELNSYTAINGQPKDPAIGETKTVYYNPGDPSQAVVNKGITSGMWLSIVLIWFVIGASLLKGFIGWGDVEDYRRYGDPY